MKTHRAVSGRPCPVAPCTSNNGPRWPRKRPSRCSPPRDTPASSTSLTTLNRFGTVVVVAWSVPLAATKCYRRPRPPKDSGKKSPKRRSSVRSRMLRSSFTKIGSYRLNTCPETSAKRWALNDTIDIKKLTPLMRYRRYLFNRVRPTRCCFI